MDGRWLALGVASIGAIAPLLARRKNPFDELVAHPGVFIAPSPVHGLGAFSRSFLPKGTNVGPSLLRVDSRGVEEDLEQAFFTRHVNHAVRGNLWFVGSSHPGFTYDFVTTRDIRPGEEFFVNYYDFTDFLQRTAESARRGSVLKAVVSKKWVFPVPGDFASWELLDLEKKFGPEKIGGETTKIWSFAGPPELDILEVRRGWTRGFVPTASNGRGYRLVLTHGDHKVSVTNHRRPQFRRGGYRNSISRDEMFETPEKAMVQAIKAAHEWVKSGLRAHEELEARLARPRGSSLRALPPPAPRYVISEGLGADQEPLFWSNDFGWVDLDSATRFSDQETQGVRLPVSGGSPGWWTLDAARKKVQDWNKIARRFRGGF
jgi:hypothetical protein